VYLAIFEYVAAFAVDTATGSLTEIAGSPFATGGDTSQCVAVDPTGKFAYVTNSGSSVSAFSINSTTGALTAIAGSPFIAGDFVEAIAVCRIAQ
jgi:DNA-binding beta-propeller fold protein YncE